MKSDFFMRARCLMNLRLLHRKSQLNADLTTPPTLQNALKTNSPKLRPNTVNEAIIPENKMYNYGNKIQLILSLGCGIIIITSVPNDI